jgi:hypothetical protein
MTQEVFNQQNLPEISPESVAYWFFRLNGCLTIVNFVVHPDLAREDEPRSQRTDVDILAVRFPHRCELFISGKPMKDHKVFDSTNLIDIAIAEVKHGRCNLNGPWIKKSDQNIHRILYAVGAFSKRRVPRVAESLYKDAYYSDSKFRVRLFAIGSKRNDNLLPKIVQLIWDEILEFIYNRMTTYREHKAQHDKWDSVGKYLYQLSTNSPIDEFINSIKNSMQKFVDSELGKI